MTSADLFKVLDSVVKVQRKLELLKPLIDKAVDDVRTMAVMVEQVEKSLKKKDK